jgi:prepilin-type N-terminal cleavage/methylation domain-containing protein
MTKRSRFGFSLIELSIVILVIGILVIGITKGSRVISEANLKSARALTASSPAVSIPDLLMWLDATSDKAFIDSERSDGGSVSNWYNNNPQRIGGGNNVAQTNANKKPLYIRSAIGSLPAIRFDGINDFLTSNLSSDTTVNLPTGNSPRTLFVVFGNASGNPGSWNFVFHYGTDGQTDRTFDLGACLTSSGGNPASLHMWNTEYLTNVKNGCDGKRYVAAVTYKGVSGSSTSNGISFYINSTYYPNNNAVARTDGSTGSSAPLTLNTTSNDLHIGSRMNGSNPFKGDVGEVIMFGRRLSDNERISVENYLKQKWQIQ